MLSFRKGRKSISRRQLMVGGATLAAGSAALVAGSGESRAAHLSAVDEVVAKAQISELRRLYGKATDLLGAGRDHDGLSEEGLSRDVKQFMGRRIYNQIFTTDANIVAGSLIGTGGDEWADIVASALASFTATQHMLGTQLVEIDELPSEHGGGGTMQTYLNALHEFAPGGTILIVRGTYFDKVRYTPTAGWQIYDMNLVFTAVETREHTPPPPPEEEAADESAAEEA